MIKQASAKYSKKIRVAITHGDFNGISYEVIIKALQDNRLLEMFTPVIFGLSKVLAFHRKNFNFHDFNYNIITHTGQVNPNKVNILNLTNDQVDIDFGKSKPEAGKYAIEALEKAIDSINEAKADVLVTAPLNKSNVVSDSFPFAGHTGYLADKFKSSQVVMLMVHGNLRVGTVTGHIPLKEVPAAISEDNIASNLAVLERSLKRDFAIPKPKIAVLGLNPHAGDDGVIGKEDKHIIYPAILKIKKQGSLVYGPFPADGFFGSGEYARYDAVLAMYHDQGLIPFKTIAAKHGVNFTAGLPIVRTSPAHGTAYNIAGKNRASAESMREAIYLAIDIYNNRRTFDENNANPLPVDAS
ncbi:MAG: 4-hydroxythreonine-4-phosphate dehydrogenase PdxA [Bacteroidetes bacterium]|nr:MAG: 4-hydroxythreonine-4-phosphate dehydrogenase PdxA [Bacteroidota bacterium]